MYNLVKVKSKKNRMHMSLLNSVLFFFKKKKNDKMIAISKVDFLSVARITRSPLDFSGKIYIFRYFKYDKNIVCQALTLQIDRLILSLFGGPRINSTVINQAASPIETDTTSSQIRTCAR